MLGNLIAKIREEKNISKTTLSKATNINIGHLTHIEKGNRHPSHKALKSLSNALNVPYQSLYHTYDKTLNEDQIEYNYINYINYTQIPVISNIDSFIDCPLSSSDASFAYKITDDSMEPNINKNSYVFIEINGLIKHKEIGLFKLNNEILVRKLLYKKNNFILKANNKKFKDIIISDIDDFKIIGKVYI